MALINDNKVIVAPIQAVKVNSVRLPMLTGKVGMIEDIISQSICRNGIIDIVALVCIPVLRELFRAKDKHRFVAVLIILDHCKRSKCLAETNAVCQNTAVEFLKFADDGKNCVALEVIKHPPDFTFLKTRCLVRQFVFRYIIKKFVENIIKRNKIDVFRCVFAVCSRNVFNHNVCNFL